MLGTGVLTLPYAFSSGGLLLGSAFVVIFCFLAFVTATFELETMSICNYVRRSNSNKDPLLVDDVVADVEEEEGEKTEEIKKTTNTAFSLSERIELNEMVEMLFKDSSNEGKRSKWNLALMIFLNASLIIYLTGTMATYSALIASTFKSLITDRIANIDSYYIFMAVTVCIGAPLSFGNFQNTKYIQIVICAARFSVYTIMVITTAVYFFQGDVDNNNDHPKDFDKYYVNFSGISSLYGNIVFTFMTHHSLPGLLSPIRPERHIKKVLATSLMFCGAAYIILCSFGMLAFWNAPILDKDRCGDNSEPCRIMETYNLNFSSYHLKWIGYYIEGYPLLMLMLFPLVAITLRNNTREFVAFLKRSFGGEGDAETLSEALILGPDNRATTLAMGGRRTNFSSENMIYTASAILPAVAIATAFENVQDITHYTGAFAGLMVMFVTPSVLVLRARSTLRKERIVDDDFELKSPFRSDCWAYFILIVALACFTFTTVNVCMGH